VSIILFNDYFIDKYPGFTSVFQAQVHGIIILLHGLIQQVEYGKVKNILSPVLKFL